MLRPTFSLVVTAFLSLAHSGCARSCDHDSTFDFIIVGGGTAGLAIATRLSQGLVNDCILVIEAGPDARNDPRIYIPGLRGSTLGSTLDWVLPTIPQAAANNRSIVHNRGKVLGGTSALNLMVWNRATVQEYDAWEELGNPGWNFKNMYPAMLKAENFQRREGVAQYGNDGVGYGGPVQIGLVEDPPAQIQAGIPTLEGLGIKENLESLNGSNIGIMYQPAMQRFSNHTRSYAVDYLAEAGDNLVIMYNTTVHKVTITGTRAAGVVLIDGTKITAGKEVIISGGSLLSPKILELSGIGQKSILDKADIEQIIDLPGVGENLQDHLRIQSTYELKPEFPGADILRYNATRAALELDLYKRGKTSLYQYAGSSYAFLKWPAISNITLLLNDLAGESVDWNNTVDRTKLALLTNNKYLVPDVEIIFGDGYIGTRGYPANNTAGYGKQYATILAGVMHPFARGNVHINSSDPAAKPVIDPRYISTPYDLHATIQAAKATRLIANTAPYSDLWVKEFDPGNEVQTIAQWEKYARDNVFTFYHPLGTCAMLPLKDGGVVDPELKVYGVEGLRVVDASVIPIIISAHIQTAVYGIAERAAELIIRSQG